MPKKAHAQAAQAISAATTQLKNAQTLADLGHATTELQSLLAKSYAREEAPDGMLYKARQAAPHHADRIDELAAEHAKLRAEVDALAGSIASVRSSIDFVVNSLLAHEEREASLIADVWYEELGEGD